LLNKLNDVIRNSLVYELFNIICLFLWLTILTKTKKGEKGKKSNINPPAIPPVYETAKQPLLKLDHLRWHVIWVPSCTSFANPLT
jgi:hypothetical protein